MDWTLLSPLLVLRAAIGFIAGLLYNPKASSGGGRPTAGLERMLLIHCLQCGLIFPTRR